jgi:hypothetical protein
MTSRRILSLATALLIGLGPAAPPATDAAGDAGIVDVRALVGRGRPTIGSQVVVLVRIQNAASVGSVPFTLRFDPTILEFVPGAAAEGDFLHQDGAQTVFIAAPVTDERGVADGRAGIAVGLSRLETSGVTGRGTLCRLIFRAKAAGTTSLEFARARVLDASATALPSRFTGATVTVRETRR